MDSAPPTGGSAGSRLATLLTLLESDPTNLALLSDAAELAVADRQPDAARALLDRCASIEPLSPSLTNLAGLAAIQADDFEAAARHFRTLLEGGVTDPAVRFNLAWSLAGTRDFAGAAALLDETVSGALPQAAMLRVQLLHEEGELDAAMLEANRCLGIFPDHEGLASAVAVLALDAGDEGLARICASKGGDHPDALATLGMLALGDDRVSEARELFDRALRRREGNPRAWVGRGLSRLLSDEVAGAAEEIDRGAEMFGDHLGSWIAAGWAHFVNHDLTTSRARFETALALDPTFAEAHGSLAVVDLLDGQIESAKARCEAALRLDRDCYSGALAKSLLAVQTGDEDSARRIFELALNMPVDGTDRTIARALSRLGR